MNATEQVRLLQEVALLREGLKRERARIHAAEVEIERLRQLYDNEHNETCRLRTALKTVGDDYPGSSCQQWCYKQAGLTLPDAGTDQ